MLSVMQKRYPYTPPASPDPSFTLNGTVFCASDELVFTCKNAEGQHHISLFVEGYRNYTLDPTGEHGGDRRATLPCTEKTLRFPCSALAAGDYVAILFGEGWRDYQRFPFSVTDGNESHAVLHVCPRVKEMAVPFAGTVEPEPFSAAATLAFQDGTPCLNFTVTFDDTVRGKEHGLALLANEELQNGKTLTVEQAEVYPAKAEDTKLSVLVMPDGEDAATRSYVVRGFVKENGEVRYSRACGTTLFSAAKAAGYAPIVDACRKRADADYRFAARTVLCGTPKEPHRSLYRLDDSHLVGRDVFVLAKRAGAPIEIVQLTDTHLSAGSPSAFAAFRRVTDYALTADRVVFTGDVIDAFAEDNLALLEREIWNVVPDALVTLGNHDRHTRSVPPEQCYERLQRVWRHPLCYHAETVDERVMLIQMDNSEGVFYREQYAPLAADLARARKENLTVLLFIHGALPTGNPPADSLDGRVTVRRFSVCGTVEYDAAVPENAGTVYGLITHSADVIGGVFCGHAHQDFYTEINACLPNGEKAVIPQHTAARSGDDAGRFLRILVKG